MKMNRTEAKKYLKGMIEDYLLSKNININKPFSCLNPTHPDKKTPSMSYKKDSTFVKCFGKCNRTYDIFDLIGWDNKTDDFNEQFKIACDRYNVVIDGKSSSESINYVKKQSRTAGQALNIDDKAHTDYIEKCKTNIDNTNYFEHRGISKDVVKHLNIGYDSDYNEYGQHWKAVMFFSSKYGYTARNTNLEATKGDRVRKRKGVASSLFNSEAIYKDVCFIVEGEFDSLSIIEAGGEACALASVSNVKLLYAALEEAQKTKTFEKPLILYLDDDDGGHIATQKLISKLKELKIPYIQWQDYRGYNDPNEALVADEVQFIEDVCDMIDRAEDYDPQEEAKQEYIKKNRTDNYIRLFADGINKSAETMAVHTGFNVLDDVLDGGLYEGLYIVGAISSLGKTTLILQIADNMAEIWQDVLIFSLEMSRTELMSKSISRLTLLDVTENNKDKSLAKTARGITTGSRYENYSIEERKTIDNATIKYGQKYAPRLYIHEGVGDIGAEQIKETIEDHIKYTGNYPVVIIDYLQLLAPYEMRATDKQNTDKAVLELKRITREHKIPIIAISSFNRQSYGQSVNMGAFKESGAIEYSSDVLIGLQAKGVEDEKGKTVKDFNIDKAKEKDPREIELKILKNRNGKTGSKIEYRYRPMFNHFEEIGIVK